MASKPRGKMPVSERAKQFMPFAVLRGLDEALAEKERELLVTQKTELSEDAAAELDAVLRSLKRGDAAEAVYFDSGEYRTLRGSFGAYNESERKVRIGRTAVPLDDIVAIRKTEK